MSLRLFRRAMEMLKVTGGSLSNLLSARSLLSHRDAARDGPCAHGKGAPLYVSFLGSPCNAADADA